MLALQLRRRGAATAAAAAAAAAVGPSTAILSPPQQQQQKVEMNNNDNNNNRSSEVTGSGTGVPVLLLLPLLRATRPLLRPQTVKPNPFTSTSGKFDQSFEKMVGSLEQKLPFRQHHLKRGYIYDHNFGEENPDQMKEAARQDVEGREPERPAARQARSYFTDEDLSPEAMHVRSPRLKVSQQVQRQNYDRSILKTSDEPEAYYYPVHSVREKQLRTATVWGGWALVAAALYGVWRRAAAYMREGYDPYAVAPDGSIARAPRG